MSYSRRQLYAMGEPIGDSATYRKADGGLVLGGGGGGGGSGSQTTTQELPEWAKPYAKSTLEKGAALSEKGYQRYGAVNPQTGKFEEGPRIAGFSPMQLDAQKAAAGMAPSAATGAGIGVAAEVAGRGLGTNYQAGQFQNQFQAPDPYQAGRFRADRVGTQSFIQPGAAESYMSPYMQNVVDVQQREARRASDIARQGQQAQAVGAGAFGGSRQALVEAERQRNLSTQLGDIQATGSQAAFQQAQQQFNADQARRLAAQQANQQYGLQAQQLGEQSRQFGAGQGLQAASLGAQYGQSANQLAEQSRQFGANLGLQGLSTALQGAGQLGALGGQQFQQGMDINKLQNAYGGQQQALRQQGLDLAYQDFQNEQNYPYKQLGFMSDLVRGLPLGQQSTQQMYQGPGSFAGQVAGLGMGALGLSKFMAEGGLAYADGGSVESPDNVDRIVSKLSDQQLQQAAQAAQARGDVDQLDAIQKEMAMRASERNGMAGAFNMLPQENQENMMQMAGGGVVAFSGEDNSFVIDPMLGTMQDTTSSTDDRTVLERLGLFNPENRRALEKAEREIAASKVVKTPEEKAFAATSTMALDSEDAKAYADQKAKAPKGPAKGIGSNAVVRQATEIAKSAGIPQETFEDTIKRIRKEIGSEDESFKKEMAGQYQKAVDRLTQQKQQAGAEALMQYGFGLAAQASKPGARFMGSVAGASPILAQALAESNKVSRAAEDNLDKLRMDQLRFEQAMRRNDLQAASQYAGLISADKKAQRQLDLQEKQLGITAAYHAQAGGSSLGKIVNELAQRDPEFANLSGQEQFKRAAQLAGYGSMYRADVGNQARMAEGIRKINEKYAMLGMLPPGSDMAKTMAAKREQDIADFKAGFSLSGEPSGGGVADNGGMRIVGVR